MAEPVLFCQVIVPSLEFNTEPVQAFSVKEISVLLGMLAQTANANWSGVSELKPTTLTSPTLRVAELGQTLPSSVTFAEDDAPPPLTAAVPVMLPAEAPASRT